MVLWVRADSPGALVAQFAGLAAHFGLPDHADADQNRLAKAVKRYLETQEEQVWLLIFDNVDDMAMVQEFLPTRGNGAILLTTRLHAVGKHMRKIELDKLPLEESMQFLLGRVGAAEEREREALPEAERQVAEQLCTLMDGLPLALDQAAAYIEQYGCTLAEYVALYQQQRVALLRLGNSVDRQDYPDSVATTWLLSFQQVEQASPAAAALLRVCAFLHPDAIPEEVFLQGAAEIIPSLQAVAEEPARLQAAIDILQKHSLVRRNAETRMLTIHRLVQAVIQDGLEETERRDWAQRVTLAVNAAFPQVKPETVPQCERLLPQALQVTQWIEQHQLVCEEAGRLLFELGAYLQYRGRPMELEPIYRRAIYIFEQLFGPEHPRVADPLDHLGTVYRHRGNYAQAERLCQRALRIREQQLGAGHPRVADSLNRLAIYYEEQGKYAEAEPLYLRSLAICEQQLGPGHDSTARALNNLANLYREQGRYAEAEPLYYRALDIWEQQLGPEHSRLGYPLTGLGALYQYQGKDAEAERFFLRALRIWEQLGETYPELDEPLIRLANLYRDQGRCAEAEPLYRRALSNREQQGPEHPLVASSLTGLAILYCGQGKDAEAEPLYLRALRIWDQQRGQTHPERAETMHGLARLREAQGNREEARSWYERALAVREQALGAQHPKTAETRERLSALLQTPG
jgi:tetratricopeptide (TPR) repeat protein